MNDERLSYIALRGTKILLVTPGPKPFRTPIDSAANEDAAKAKAREIARAMNLAFRE